MHSCVRGWGRPALEAFRLECRPVQITLPGNSGGSSLIVMSSRAWAILPDRQRRSASPGLPYFSRSQGHRPSRNDGSNLPGSPIDIGLVTRVSPGFSYRVLRPAQLSPGHDSWFRMVFATFYCAGSPGLAGSIATPTAPGQSHSHLESDLRPLLTGALHSTESGGGWKQVEIRSCGSRLILLAQTVVAPTCIPARKSPCRSGPEDRRDQRRRRTFMCRCARDFSPHLIPEPLEGPNAGMTCQPLETPNQDGPWDSPSRQLFRCPTGDPGQTHFELSGAVNSIRDLRTCWPNEENLPAVPGLTGAVHFIKV